MKRRATSMLFAVATSSAAVFAADPAPKPAPSRPLTLPSGAPACGNVMNKYMTELPKGCVSPQARVILTAIAEDLGQILQVFALFDSPETNARPSLTLATEVRPRS